MTGWTKKFSVTGMSLKPSNFTFEVDKHNCFFLFLTIVIKLQILDRLCTYFNVCNACISSLPNSYKYIYIDMAAGCH